MLLQGWSISSKFHCKRLCKHIWRKTRTNREDATVILGSDHWTRTVQATRLDEFCHFSQGPHICLKITAGWRSFRPWPLASWQYAYALIYTCIYIYIHTRTLPNDHSRGALHWSLKSQNSDSMQNWNQTCICI